MFIFETGKSQPVITVTILLDCVTNESSLAFQGVSCYPPQLCPLRTIAHSRPRCHYRAVLHVSVDEPQLAFVLSSWTGILDTQGKPFILIITENEKIPNLHLKKKLDSNSVRSRKQSKRRNWRHTIRLTELLVMCGSFCLFWIFVGCMIYHRKVACQLKLVLLPCSVQNLSRDKKKKSLTGAGKLSKATPGKDQW